jgi:ribosomal protein L37AE/L43A
MEHTHFSSTWAEMIDRNYYAITCGQCERVYVVRFGARIGVKDVFCESCGRAAAVAIASRPAQGGEPEIRPLCPCGGRLLSILQPACPHCTSRLMKKVARHSHPD